MKILSLKALNINSLKGEIAIDFEALTKQSALFAIVGPTGSGKSTLLDIISCALYGRTARLKNPNDLMSRHAGEAYCEVEFEVKGKRYRSSWAQRRARKKYDGAFQSAKMELVDVSADKILPLKSREVPKKVEDLCGLDFGRFTQSMLLAQGGFDAFLRADEKERSALLEKITGTQIYATISQKVFETYRLNEQEIESDQKVLDSIELLEPKDVAKMQAQLSQNILEKKESDTKLKSITTALNWLQRVIELREEKRHYEEEFDAVAQLKEEHKDSFEKLALANRALNISSAFSAYTQLQKSVTEDSARVTQLTKELSLLDEAIHEKTKEHLYAKTELQKSSTSFEEESQKIKYAREMQTQEHQIQQNIEKEEDLLQVKQKNLIELSNTLKDLTSEYDNVQKELKKQQAYLMANAKDENLVAQVGVIEQNIKEYKKEQENFADTRSKLEDIEKKLLTKESSYTQKKEEVEKLAKIAKEKEQAYTTLEQKSFDDLTLEATTQQNLAEIQALMRAFENYTQLVKSRDEEQKAYEQNTQLLDSLQARQKTLLQHIDEMKKHIETLREKQEREQLLTKYEEDRARLVAGEPCMLCGATEHPFAKDFEVIEIDKTKEMIQSQTQALQKQEKELQKLASDISVAQTKQESSQLEIQKLDKTIATLKELFKKHSFEPSDDSEIALKEKEQELTQKLEAIKQNRFQKEELLKARDKANKEFQLQEKQLAEMQSSIEKIHSEKEQLLMALQSNESKMKELLDALASLIKAFDLPFETENLDALYQKLLQRKERYLKTMDTSKHLESQLHRYSIDKKESETKLSSLDHEIKQVQANIQELQEKLRELSTQRVAILNVADLDIYEKEITAQHKRVQEKEQAVSRELGELSVKYKERLANKETLEKKIEQERTKLKQLKAELDELYRENGFENTQAFTKALLEQEEREKLALFCKDIQERYNKLQTLKLQSIQRLQEHEKEPLTDKSKEELEIIESLLKQKVDALQESIGSDKKVLELNEKKSHEFKVKIEKLQKKKEIFTIWIKLNELIGSADGAKFKKFAQGVTLDQLIYLANEHLKILSDRYRLSRNQEKLLELEVIDAYQGNVMRSVSTLSGGESFIVSLALALGLSELASQKISIDSLFLDEGFGTLDAQSLETALNALNLLQSSGKMVGVISHVEALKEQIPLQIKVTPRGDGTSFLEIVD